MELLLDLGDTGITSNTVLKAQMTNLVNRSYDNVVSQILQNEGDYTWDDYNNADFPIGSTNLVTTPGSEQSDYALPVAGVSPGDNASTFLRLIKAQVKDANGYYQNLKAVSETMTDTPLETLFSVAGFPKFYKQLGNSVFLYPAPLAAQVTAVNGLKLFFQRDKVDFVVGDTTKQPGFPSIYHYLLPLEASETWAAIKGMKQLAFIQQKKAEFMKNLGWGIANANKDIRQRIQPIRRGASYE